VLSAEAALRIIDEIYDAQTEDEVADILLIEYYKGPTSPDPRGCHACSSE